MPSILSCSSENFKFSNVSEHPTEELRSIRFCLMQFFASISPFVMNSSKVSFNFWFDNSLHCQMYSSDSSEGFILDSNYYGFTVNKSGDIVSLNALSSSVNLVDEEIVLPKTVDFDVKTRIFGSFEINKKSSTIWPVATMVYNFFAPFLFSLQVSDPIAFTLEFDAHAYCGQIESWSKPLRIFDVIKEHEMDLFDSLLICSDGSSSSLAASTDFTKFVHVICLDLGSLHSDEFDIVGLKKIRLGRKLPGVLFSNLDSMMASFGALAPPLAPPLAPVMEPLVAAPNESPILRDPPEIISDILSAAPIAKIKRKRAVQIVLESEFIEPLEQPEIPAFDDPWKVFNADFSDQKPTLILNSLIELSRSFDSIFVASGLVTFPNIALPGSSNILEGPYDKYPIMEYIHNNGKNNLFKTQISGGRGGNQKDITIKSSIVMRDLEIFGQLGLSPTEVWKCLEYHDMTHKRGILFAINENKIKFNKSQFMDYVSSAESPKTVSSVKKRRTEKKDSSASEPNLSDMLADAPGFGLIGSDFSAACMEDQGFSAEVVDENLEEQKASLREIFGRDFMDFSEIQQEEF